MPLSEEEQRILQEIEQQFHADDHRLAVDIGGHSLYSDCLRQMKRAALVFLAGVIVLVVALATATSFLVAFGGFVVMLGAALWFERSLRHLGRAGMDRLTDSLRAGGLRDYLGMSGSSSESQPGSESDD